MLVAMVVVVEVEDEKDEEVELVAAPLTGGHSLCGTAHW